MPGGIENRLLRYCVVVVFAALLAGCASTSETTTIQENLSILNQRQAAIEARLQSTEGASRRSGDLYARMEELQTQMRALNGRIEQLEHKLDQLQRTQASAAQAPAQEPSMPPSGTVVMEEAPPSSHPPRPQAQASVQSPPSAAEISPRTGVVSLSPDVQGKNAEQPEFDRGLHLMQQKKYDEARKEFQGFVSKFPKSGLEETALYDIGECYFLEKHYEEAIKAYQQVVDKYPKGGKTASALLKQGMGWQQMGETTMARIIYTRLVEKFPGSTQAQAAQKKLQQM
jgi:tol-pal system protein YbgF